MDIFFFIVRFSCDMWNVFFNWFGLSWIMPRQVVDLYACWWTAGNTQSAAV